MMLTVHAAKTKVGGFPSYITKLLSLNGKVWAHYCSFQQVL